MYKYMNVIFNNHISYQVPRSLPHQPRLLPLLFCLTSVQESKFFPGFLGGYLDNSNCDHDHDDEVSVIDYLPRDVDWRIFCLKITRTREEVGLSREHFRKKRMFTFRHCLTTMIIEIP